VTFVIEVPFPRHTYHLRFTPFGLTSKFDKGDVVVDQRKQAVSIRLGESDIRNIKRAAKRLGVRDSDIIRFAIKSTLNRIAPLCDEAIRGRNLVPVLVESGDELIRYFELDAFRLESIINEHVEEGRQVDRDDVALLAMSGLREEYLVMRLKDGDLSAADPALRARSLRGYLYDKYVYRSVEHRSDGNGYNRNGSDDAVPQDLSVRLQLRQPVA
jgi:(2Fe-2S) ferredoxin